LGVTMGAGELVLVLIAYGVPIAWGIAVLVRLREQRDLLRRISEDIASLRDERNGSDVRNG